MAGNLQIIGAAYGLARVTGQVMGLVDRQASPQTLNVQVGNAVFGDSWPGNHKSLTVVYRYDDGLAEVAVAAEHQTMVITPQSVAPAPAAAAVTPHLFLWGASYGLGDVTNRVQGLISQQTLSFTPDNATFGDTWPGVNKGFVIVANYTNQVPFVDIVIENNAYFLKFRPPLLIMSAFWGLKDVTSVAQANVSRRTLTISASNASFGDGWPGVPKSLDLVYQYGDRQPQLEIVQEGSVLDIDFDSGWPTYRPPGDPRTLNVIRAAFGLADVTAAVASLVSSNQLNLTADVGQFGDSWPGVQKSFTLLYSWGPAAVSSLCVPEQATVALAQPTIEWMTSFLSMAGVFADGDQLMIQTGAGRYWRVESDNRITASAESSDTATPFRIGLASADSAEMILAADDNSYLVIGDDGTLTSGGTAGDAVRIVASLLNNGTIALSTSGGTGKTFMSVNQDGGITASGSYASNFSTAFNLLLSVTAEGTENHLRAVARLASAASATEQPDPLLLKVIWDLTGGLFLAVGLSPLIDRAAQRVPILNLLRANQVTWASIEQILTKVRDNPEASWTIAFLAIEAAIYDAGLTWEVFRLVAQKLKWYLISFALAKILEVILIPEFEIAELTVDFAIWTYETQTDILAYINSAEGAAHLARIDRRAEPATTQAA